MGLFLQEEVKQGELPDVLDALRAQDAVVIIPHPFDIFRKAFKELNASARKVDVIEGFNARCYFSSFNMQALAFAAGHSIPVSAGSDAHFPFEFANAYTEIKASSLEEFRKKLVKGKTVLHGKKARLSVHLWTQLAKLGLAADTGAR